MHHAPYMHGSPVSVPCHNQSEVRKIYCAVEFVSVIEASKLVTIEV